MTFGRQRVNVGGVRVRHKVAREHLDVRALPHRARRRVRSDWQVGGDVR